MNSLNNRNDSMVEIVLCNEKIQEENLAIKNEVNRLNVLLEKAEADKKDIQKYMDEIENIIGGSEKKINKIGEKAVLNNFPKQDLFATIMAVIFMLVIGYVNCVCVNKNLEWKVQHRIVIIAVYIMTIVTSAELAFHTGICAKKDINKRHYWVTRIPYFFLLLFFLFLNENTFECISNYMNYIIIILSTFAFIITFISNYIEHTGKQL